jgi:hypothetical protein
VTVMRGQEKMSLEDALVHYGVLGMKWGKSRAKASSGQIHDARDRQMSRVEVVGDAKKALVKDSRTRLKSGRAAEGPSAKLKKNLDDAEKDFLDNPDRAIAVRMTRGEKALSLALAGPVGLVLIGATSATSRRIEQKQDKKKP